MSSTSVITTLITSWITVTTTLSSVFSQCSRWWSCCCISVCYLDSTWCPCTSPPPASWTPPPSNNALMSSATREPPWWVSWSPSSNQNVGTWSRPLLNKFFTYAFTLPHTFSHLICASQRVKLLTSAMRMTVSTQDMERLTPECRGPFDSDLAEGRRKTVLTLSIFVTLVFHFSSPALPGAILVYEWPCGPATENSLQT